jgi:hypothetical protein
VIYINISKQLHSFSLHVEHVSLRRYIELEGEIFVPWIDVLAYFQVAKKTGMPSKISTTFEKNKKGINTTDSNVRHLCGLYQH